MMHMHPHALPYFCLSRARSAARLSLSISRTGLACAEAVHLTAELPQLLLEDVPQAGGLLAPQLGELDHQHLVLLLQEAHLLDVAGEAVVQPHQLHLLVGASLAVLRLQQRVGREVQSVGAPGGQQEGAPREARGPGGAVERVAAGGQADAPPGAGPLAPETLPVGRQCPLTLHAKERGPMGRQGLL